MKDKRKGKQRERKPREIRGPAKTWRRFTNFLNFNRIAFVNNILIDYCILISKNVEEKPRKQEKWSFFGHKKATFSRFVLSRL